MTDSQTFEEHNHRLFFAIPLNISLLNTIQDIQHNLALKQKNQTALWIKREKLHITLNFLGNAKTAQIQPLIESVATTTRSLNAFNLKITGLIPFPNRYQPRMIALDVAPLAPLLNLVSKINYAMIPHGFTPEQRAYRPHITLARFPHVHFPNVHHSDTWGSLEETVHEFCLYETRPLEQGTEYAVLHRFLLGVEY